MDLLWLLERPPVPCTPLQLDARGVPTNNQSTIYQPPSTAATAHPYYRGPPLNTLGHHRPPSHQPHHHQHHHHQQQQQLRMMPHQPRQSSFDQTIGTALIDQTIPLAAHPLSSHPAAFPPYAMQIGGGFDMARAQLSGPVRAASPARGVGRRKDYAAPPGVWKNSGGYVSTVYVNRRRLYGPLRRTVTEATEDRRRLLSAKESHATESEVRDLIASMRQVTKPKIASFSSSRKLYDSFEGATAHSPGQARDPIFPRDIAGNPLTDLRGLPPGPPPSRASIYGGSLSTFRGRPGSLPLPSHHLSFTPPLDSGFLEADVYEPS